MDFSKYAEIMSEKIDYSSLYFEKIKAIGDNLMNTMQSYNRLSEIIKESMKPILDNWDAIMEPLRKATRPLRAMSILADNQFVQWERLDNELIDQILEAKNVNKVLKVRNENEKYKRTFEIAEACLQHPNIEGRQAVFGQSIEAFRVGLYELTAISLTATIDGILANIYTDDTVTSIKDRVRALLDQANSVEDLSDAEYSIFALTYTVDKMTDSFAASSDFSGHEPKLLNRHWIMHGRCKRRRTKLDCVKLIRYIYGLLLLSDIGKDEKAYQNPK